MGSMFSFFQSLGISTDSHDFSNIMKCDLATTSALSLRTLGRISSGPMDLHTFSFIRLSLACSTVKVGWNPVLSPTASGSGSWQIWGALPSVKTEAKHLLSTLAFSMSEEASSLSSFIRGGKLSLVLLLLPTYLQNPSLLFFTSLATFSSICALAFLILSHVQTTSLHSSQATQPCLHFLFLSLFSPQFKLQVLAQPCQSHGNQKYTYPLKSICYALQNLFTLI